MFYKNILIKNKHESVTFFSYHCRYISKKNISLKLKLMGDIRQKDLRITDKK